MATIPLYRDVLCTLTATAPGTPVWPLFEAQVYRPHQAYFDGLQATYGETLFGPGGLRGAVETCAPALRERLPYAAWSGLETEAPRLLAQVTPLLPGDPPDLYLGTLFFTAPAGTISVSDRPAIALGLERFHPTPPRGWPKVWYHPSEVAEMIPHEAAHAARMQVLNLPPTPRRLSLLDMVMLEGTALTFTDLLLGKQTLATFMPPDHLAWHEAHRPAVLAAAAADFDQVGMDVFTRYFSPHSPISGYYVGYCLCRDYLQRHGPDSIRELIGLDSRSILARLQR